MVWLLPGTNMNAISSSTPPVHSPWITFSNTLFEIILTYNTLIWLLNLFKKVCNVWEFALRVTMLHNSALQRSSAVISVCKPRHSMLSDHLCPSLPIITNSSVSCPATHHSRASVIHAGQTWACADYKGDHVRGVLCSDLTFTIQVNLPCVKGSLAMKGLLYGECRDIIHIQCLVWRQFIAKVSQLIQALVFCQTLSREKDLLRSSNDV